MKQSILDTLLARVSGDAVPVREVMVGVHWTAVCVGSSSNAGGCGMAASLLAERPHGHPAVREVGTLHTKSAQELAEWSRSDHLLEASIGVAALNALLAMQEGEATRHSQEINAAEVLAQAGRDRTIAMVGHFPFTERLRAAARHLWVIEKQPQAGDLPEEAAAEFLPQADVIAITGSALTNHTLDGLLALCPPRAKVMLLGPSTTLSPLLFDYGVHWASGVRVIDEAAALRTIMQGATFPQVRGVKLLTLVAPSPDNP